jgi:hypothetical protein
MSEGAFCETHVWASVGVVTREGTVCKIWECENCPAWTAEPFDPDAERDWEATWLSGR